MFSSAEPMFNRSTDQVSLTVVRKSDGLSVTFVLNEKTRIHDLKHELKRRLKPRSERGYRLIFRNKVLKGKHTLKHYGIKKGVNDQAIAMDDTKDWKSSSSSSSDSEQEK
ncbi:unnamed protein product [Rotaria magnacalcarata]|uniref:Ubiquitin-like domain-containing protein n=2 Tax=Rotaria magnacalcarata TaxID=392030 RepID=A0A814T3D3_9BILA|nr:unnamed protein product [Rotaria magnacalcarata]CAF1678788.1 unnamed protein product [Rotaria magnacalcarata]CAF2102751.1 unnamed protein product [Rotaria magnacalcarata]CAF2156218.1 unnamed protein product [Rotaria magnacalcarata]CAF3950425.1 unnamed protein product [Rotaria magnacalcarata]